jgi:hypothetical protein
VLSLTLFFVIPSFVPVSVEDLKVSKFLLKWSCVQSGFYAKMFDLDTHAHAHGVPVSSVNRAHRAHYVPPLRIRASLSTTVKLARARVGPAPELSSDYFLWASLRRKSARLRSQGCKCLGLGPLRPNVEARDTAFTLDGLFDYGAVV